MDVYDHRKIEVKWQKKWKEAGIYQPDLRKAKKPFFNLMMFPYPSAEGLHVGNMYAFTGADVYGRYQRMQGYDIFEPIGLDGFGIHSENYAISIGKHPAEQAKVSERRFYEQLSAIGNGFAWDQKLETYDPKYYKWTQWLFVQMFKHGLAVRKKAMVNWCPSCKTVLADEQVEGGRCERCGSETTRRETEQWFFKITEYAQRLLDNIDGTGKKKQETGNNGVIRTQFRPMPKGYDPRLVGLRWPEKIKIAQRNWIGKSEGTEIDWNYGKGRTITTFTTRLDTIFGVTFLVVAPEHPIVASLLNSKFKIQSSKLREVKSYIEGALKKTEQKRQAAEKEKTGVDSGLRGEHPLTGEPIPIWIAEFVLKDYGTGAVMGVPAHDQRDYEFASQHHLPIRKVIEVAGKSVADVAVTEYGTLVGSGLYDGYSSQEAMKGILRDLEAKKAGRKAVSYHLRDGLISRQRDWGTPIPILICQQCAKRGRTFKGGYLKGMAGWWPASEEELPVLLPEMSYENVRPAGDGKAPLEKAPESWLYTKCPQCGGRAKRETDVSDTFLDSSWYFLRYPSVNLKNSKHETRNGEISNRFEFRDSNFEIPWDQEVTRSWLPVDAYIGGAEHAVLHLLYSRFVTMALHDWDYLPFEEPFPFLFSHGLIIKDGAKMSKSRGNVVIPDDYINKFGSDTLRLYLMFLGPYDLGGDFQDTGIAGMYRFLTRVWKLYQDNSKLQLKNSKLGKNSNRDLERSLHRTIQKVTEDIGKFKFNTAIAFLMEFVNEWEDGGSLSREDCGSFLKLLAPFSPHISEELWQVIQQKEEAKASFSSIHVAEWPSFDEQLTQFKEVEIVVQVNGKLRGKFSVSAKDSENKEKLIALAREVKGVLPYVTAENPKAIIWVKGKLVNFVLS